MKFLFDDVPVAKAKRLRAKKKAGYWVATDGLLRTILPPGSPHGWYVVHIWDVVAGPFSAHEMAVAEMEGLQSPAPAIASAWIAGRAAALAKVRKMNPVDASIRAALEWEQIEREETNGQGNAEYR